VSNKCVECGVAAAFFGTPLCEACYSQLTFRANQATTPESVRVMACGNIPVVEKEVYDGLKLKLKESEWQLNALRLVNAANLSAQMESQMDQVMLGKGAVRITYLPLEELDKEVNAVGEEKDDVAQLRRAHDINGETIALLRGELTKLREYIADSNQNDVSLAISYEKEIRELRTLWECHGDKLQWGPLQNANKIRSERLTTGENTAGAK
jgi:hypothetical protein